MQSSGSSSPYPILSSSTSAHDHPQIYTDTSLAISPDLLNIPFLSNSGSLMSEPDYPFPLRASFIHGSDYLRRDPDGEHVRLQVTSTAIDISGALVLFSYTGIVDMTGDEGDVIRGDGNATTTGFGNICEWVFKAARL